MRVWQQRLHVLHGRVLPLLFPGVSALCVHFAFPISREEMHRAGCRVLEPRQACAGFRFSCRLVGGTPKYKLSRADRIRTCDLFVPNEARYQPALQLDACRTRCILHEKSGLTSPKLHFFPLHTRFVLLLHLKKTPCHALRSRVCDMNAIRIFIRRPAGSARRRQP